MGGGRRRPRRRNNRRGNEGDRDLNEEEAARLEQMYARRKAYQEKQAKRDYERSIREKKEQREFDNERRLESKAYKKWQRIFEKSISTSSTEKKTTLEVFITQIKARKVVDLESLGEEFGLTEQECRARIEWLLLLRRLQGFFMDDDRFLAVSEMELGRLTEVLEEKKRFTREEMVGMLKKALKI